MICSYRAEWFDEVDGEIVNDYGLVAGKDPVDITAKLLSYFGDDKMVRWTLMPLDGDVQVMDEATLEKIEKEDFNTSY